MTSDEYLALGARRRMAVRLEAMAVVAGMPGFELEAAPKFGERRRGLARRASLKAVYKKRMLAAKGNVVKAGPRRKGKKSVAAEKSTTATGGF